METGRPKRKRRKTVRGYRNASRTKSEGRAELQVQSRSGKERGAAKEPVSAKKPDKESAGAPDAFVQVEYVHDSSSQNYSLAAPWWMYEIRTHNRIYCLNESLVCIHVLSREDRQNEPTHSLHGARLLGGKVVGATGGPAELSHPLPRRGAMAVFERRVGRRVSLSETSEVDGILLRLRVVDVSAPQGARLWRKVTGRQKPHGRGGT